MPDHPHGDEFYVGYVPAAPPGVARRVAGAVAAQTACAAALGFLLALAMPRTQEPPGAADPAGTWQSGAFVERTGVLRMNPYPALEVEGTGGPSTILLVEMGKVGAQARAAPHADQRVRITGPLLARAGLEIIELAPDETAITALGGAAAAAAPATDLGQVTLRGEIVDPKCFLGAMKPGEGKTHKACAALCIRGGIPPVLAVWDPAGEPHAVLLAGPDSGAFNGPAATRAGEAVEVSGRLERRSGILVLKVESSSLTRP